MPAITYPVIQSGTFDAGTTVNLYFLSGALDFKEYLRDVTGTANASAMIDKRHIHGFPTVDFVGRSVLAIESTTTFSLGQSGSMATPLLTMCANTLSLRKVWPLFDVTCSGDTKKRWLGGIPIVSGTVMGFSTGAALATTDFASATTHVNSGTITLDIDQVGTFTGTAKFKGKSLRANWSSGGPIPVQYTFVFDGSTNQTFTADSANYTWLYAAATTASKGTTFGGTPVFGQLDLDVGTSTNISNDALLYDVTITSDMGNGGEVRADTRFRFD